MEPKKEPKKAAFVAVNAAGCTPTGFNADHRSLAARLRRARGAQCAPLNKGKIPEK